jgi:hypothetical protein
MDGLIGLDRYAIDVFGDHDRTGCGQPMYTRDSLDALLRWHDEYRTRNGASGPPVGLVRLTAHLVAPLDFPRGLEERNGGVNVQYDGSLLVIGAPDVDTLVEAYSYVLQWTRPSAQEQT